MMLKPENIMNKIVEMLGTYHEENKSGEFQDGARAMADAIVSQINHDINDHETGVKGVN